jgi:hypothetical protein
MKIRAQFLRLYDSACTGFTPGTNVCEVLIAPLHFVKPRLLQRSIPVTNPSHECHFPFPEYLRHRRA